MPLVDGNSGNPVVLYHKRLYHIIFFKSAKIIKIKNCYFYYDDQLPFQNCSSCGTQQCRICRQVENQEDFLAFV